MISILRVVLMVVGILRVSRLPAKSLLQFGIVCKPFHGGCDDGCFDKKIHGFFLLRRSKGALFLRLEGNDLGFWK